MSVGADQPPVLMPTGRSALATIVLAIIVGLTVADRAPAQVARGLSCFRIAVTGPKGNKQIDGSGGVISATGCRVRTPATSLCIRTATEAGTSGGEVPNWYLCYRVKCPARGHDLQMMVTDESGAHSVRLRKAQTLCTPVTSYHGRVSCPCADQSTVAACIPDCLTDFEVCDQVCADHGGALGGASCVSLITQEACKP